MQSIISSDTIRVRVHTRPAVLEDQDPSRSMPLLDGHPARARVQLYVALLRATRVCEAMLSKLLRWAASPTLQPVCPKHSEHNLPKASACSAAMHATGRFRTGQNSLIGVANCA